MRRSLHAILFVLGGCVAGLSATPAAAQTPAACGCAFIKDQQVRNVGVVFAGTAAPVPARPGMVIHKGDLIRVARPASGTLTCDNKPGLVAIQPTPRNQPVPCSNSPREGILIGRAGRSVDSTTMNDASGVGFPMLLSPRSTKLLDARPLLRWASLADVTVYKITVRSDGGSWSAAVPARPGSEMQELVYPPPCAPGQSKDCAPALAAGQSYKLIIEANGRSSEEEDLPNLGFTLLTDEEAMKVKRRAEEIKRLDLPDPLKVQMLASLYANGGLNSDAISALESLPAGQRGPESVRLLGNLYLKLGLTRRAEALYLSLLKADLLAQDTPAGKALTHQTLGEIYEAIGNTNEAIRYYAEAGRLYHALGDQESAGRIDGRLSDLRR